MNCRNHRKILRSKPNRIDMTVLETSIDSVRPVSCRKTRNLSVIHFKDDVLNRTLFQTESSETRRNSAVNNVQVRGLTHRGLTHRGLTHRGLSEIYRAKCADLNVPVVSGQETRFFWFCSKNFIKRRLSLKNCGIGVASAAAIGNLLKKNTHFPYILLSRNTLGDSGGHLLVSSLVKNRSIVHLNLSSNAISPEGFARILKLLKRHESLTSLDISSCEGLHRNRLGTVGAAALQKYLEANEVLSILNVAGTCIGPGGLGKIADGLAGNRVLLALNVARNSEGMSRLKDFTKGLAMSVVEDLNLAGNSMGDEGCVLMVGLLAGNYGHCRISRLDLSRNEISKRGATELFSVLRHNTGLSCLDLEGNLLSSGVPSSIFDCLVHNHTLVSLSLARCQLRIKGFSLLSEGLARNSTLKHLNLAYNNIDDHGMEFLCKGIAQNKGIRTLDLTGNAFKDKGGISVASSIKRNTTLQTLILKQNKLKDETGFALNDALSVNKTLLRLSLDSTSLSMRCKNDIDSRVNSNNSQYSASLVPILNKKVQELRIPCASKEQMSCRLNQKLKEKHNLLFKKSQKLGKLNQVKQEEGERLESLRTQFEGLHSQNLLLAQTLKSYGNQLEALKLQQSSEVAPWVNLISQTGQLPADSTICGDEYLKLRETLKSEEAIYSSAKQTLDSLRSRLYSLSEETRSLAKQKLVV